jgi:hypothetical protein
MAGKSSINEGLNGKIIDKWGIFPPMFDSQRVNGLESPLLIVKSQIPVY